MECATCGKIFRLRYDLIRHLRYSCTKKRHIFKNFDSETDFTVWKNELERTTTSAFVQNRGIVKGKDNIIYKYFVCNRSGTFKSGVPPKDRKRRIKSQGSAKVQCPAFMKMKMDISGEIFLTYNLEHNHEPEVQYIRLQKPVKADIAEKLKQGLSKRRILNDIRNSSEKYPFIDRTSLLAMQDLANISRDFKVDRHVKRDPIDSVSVDLQVKDLELLEDNPILFYKSRGTTDANGCVDSDDFVLILMNRFQKGILTEFGVNSRICVDSTHDTNPHGVQLHTVLVIDKLGNGYPVAFCFSDRRTQALYKLFFQSIFNALGYKIQAHIFLSDDDPASNNAWSEVMGKPQYRLLCPWHVLHDWEENLCKVPVEKRSEIFKSLKVLLKQLNPEDFVQMLENFSAKLLSAGDDMRSFYTYFMNTYYCRSELWALCYRKRLQMNTNSYLEALHKKIRYFYLDWTVNGRLDFTLDRLKELMRDLVYDRFKKLCKNMRSSYERTIRCSHDEGSKIFFEANESIVCLHESKWNVKSQNSKNVTYVIDRIDAVKACTCQIRCEDCNICFHSYSCSCIGSLCDVNICEHIHAVVLSIQQPEETTEFIHDESDRFAVSLFNDNIIVDEHTTEAPEEDFNADVQDEMLMTTVTILDFIPWVTENTRSTISRKVAYLVDLDKDMSEKIMSEEDYTELDNCLDKCIEIYSKYSDIRWKEENSETE